MIRRRIVAGIVAASFTLAPLSIALVAHAAVADWQKGATMVPRWTEDYANDTFRQSLRDLKAAGASHVALTVPYYQSNIYSTDIQPGWNTPIDVSLISAIDYAHGIGLGVTLKPLIESYDGSWRAYINPGDRDGWFNAYRNYLVHLAQIAQMHRVEMIAVGTEMVSLAAHTMNSTNTQHWADLIGAVRSVYSGKLTYGANSNDNGDSPFLNEKRYIAFWGQLDYAGLSIYYGHTGDDSVDSLKGSWNYWNNNDIRGFAQTVGKPVLFLEIGYRSVDGSRGDPWNYGRDGSFDEQEQANLYEALMSYWNDYSYVTGVYWWNWETDPNAGGQGNIDYTPQHKLAQGVMSHWFGSPPAPGQPPQAAAFSSTGFANPQGFTAGGSTQINADIKNLDGVVSSAIVDVEAYDQSNNRVFQQFYSGQNFGTGESRHYVINWKPDGTGEYRIATGIFSANWAQDYHWNNSLTTVSVGGAGGGAASPPPAPTPGAGAIEVWWPTDGANVSGVQPLKVMLQSSSVDTYRMFWDVGGGKIEMFNSAEDYPHKEAWVDYSGWNWNGSGPYAVTFFAFDLDGATLAQKTVNIFVR